jgi:hypothetical protein
MIVMDSQNDCMKSANKNYAKQEMGKTTNGSNYCLAAGPVHSQNSFSDKSKTPHGAIEERS